MSKWMDLEPVLFNAAQPGLWSSRSSLYFHITAASLSLPLAGGRVARALHLPI